MRQFCIYFFGFFSFFGFFGFVCVRMCLASELDCALAKLHSRTVHV